MRLPAILPDAGQRGAWHRDTIRDMPLVEPLIAAT